MARAGISGDGRGPSPSPARRPRISREFVENYRRRAVVDAVAELAHEPGVYDMTVAEICERVRMGRNTFYVHFRSISDCLAYGFEETSEELTESIRAAYAQGDSWLEGLIGAVGAFYAAVAQDPLRAELCLIHSESAVGKGQGRYFDAVVAALAEVIGGWRDEERGSSHTDHEPAAGSEEVLAGGIVSFAAHRIRQEKTELLPDHRDEMVLLVISTLRGPEAMPEAWRLLGR